MRMRLTLLVLPAFLVTACGYMLKVSSQHDPKTNFAALKTYKWLPKKDTAPGDPRVDNDVVKAKVKEAANEVLYEEGYSLTTDDKPDFLIAYHITTADIPGDDQIPNYWGYYPIWQGGIGFYTSPVEEGTIVIDIIDPKSMHMIWRGTGERQLVENDSPQDRIDRIERNVRKIMQQFPPK